MKPIVILSTTVNPDYLFCLPIVAKSWEIQGWSVCANVESNEVIECVNKRMNFGDIDWYEHKVKGLDTVSISQIIRLWSATNLLHDKPVCIGDADMFIASDFLYKRFDLINVFGHDLTGQQHIPICYVTAYRDLWREFLDIQKSDSAGDNIEWEEWMLRMIKKYGGENKWCWDQDIMTGCLKEYGYDKINFINRGTDPNNLNLPLGRWDRYGGFKKPSGQIHDVHLPRQPYSDENFPKIVAMCKDIYPNENWDWLDEYRNEFLKTINI